MLHMLEEKDFIKVKNLVNPNYISVQLQSVINGTNPGFVYVDTLESPKTAIVYHQGEGGFYFIGNHESKAFLDNIDVFMTSIKEELRNNDINDFEFSGDSNLWDETFRRIFYMYDLSLSEQRVYLLKDKQSITKYPLHSDYKLRNIDADLLSQPKIKSISFVKDEILNWWFNFDDYLSHGIGFVAMKNDKIVGRCLLDCKTDNLMAIGIAVKEKFRDLQIASSLATEVIQQVLDKGYTPYWECMDDNLPSIKLAEKCGFTLAFKYNLYHFSF